MYDWQSFWYLHTIIMHTFGLYTLVLSPCFFLPLLIPFLLPSQAPLLTWNPPCCDRIRPPWSQVARKLISSFPSLPICSPSVPHLFPIQKPRPLWFSQANAPSTETTSQLWFPRPAQDMISWFTPPSPPTPLLSSPLYLANERVRNWSAIWSDQ
jgi:hypothetical protein